MPMYYGGGMNAAHKEPAMMTTRETFTEHYIHSSNTHALVFEIDMPALEGQSKEQIRYGNDARSRAVRAALHIFVDSPARAADFDSDPARRAKVLAAFREAVLCRPTAREWIGASAIDLVREAIRTAVQ